MYFEQITKDREGEMKKQMKRIAAKADTVRNLHFKDFSSPVLGCRGSLFCFVRKMLVGVAFYTSTLYNVVTVFMNNCGTEHPVNQRITVTPNRETRSGTKRDTKGELRGNGRNIALSRGEPPVTTFSCYVHKMFV